MQLLRYPGGKSQGDLHRLIIDKILERYSGGLFAECFFGSGSVTIKLLTLGILDKIIICEKDESLLYLWEKVVGDPEYLLSKVKKYTPSVKSFIHYKSKILSGEVDAFGSLVVNRLAHGGRGVKAGPQGGYEQRGKYKIDCRWNRKKLVERIEKLHGLFNTVEVQFSNDYHVEADFYYADPPYWEVGKSLYLHSFVEEDHKKLKGFLAGRNFLLSYNNHTEIKELWQDHPMIVTGTRGNGGLKPDTELLIWSE